MGKTRILYAEDDVVNRKLLKIKLEQFENVVCDLVEDGVTALEMFKKNKYDLVLLDQYMPNMDGMEVAQCIRELSDDIPMVAITSDDGISKKSFLDSGFNEVLIKPIHGDKAMKIILSLLNNKRDDLPQKNGHVE